MSLKTCPVPRPEVLSLIIRSFVLLCLVVAALWFGYTARNAILLLFAGLIFSVLLCGVIDRLQRLSGIPRRVVFGLMLTLLLVAIGLLGNFGIPAAIAGAKNVAGEIPDALEQFRNSAIGRELLGAGGQQPLDYLEQAVQEGDVGKALGTAMTVFNAFTSVFLVLVVAIFMAAEPDHYRAGIINSFPKRHRDNARKVVDAIGSALWKWLNGQLIAMLLIGIIVTIGLSLIGVDYAITLGILAGFLQFIPILGPALFAIPALIVVMATSPDKVLAVLILYVVVQAVESNFITPMILKNEAYLPPVVSLTATVAMGAVFGLPGIILASPIVVVFLAIYQRGYREICLQDSKMVVAGQPDEDDKKEEAHGEKASKPAEDSSKPGQ